MSHDDGSAVSTPGHGTRGIHEAPLPIAEIARRLGLHLDEFESYGRLKAKVPLDAIARRAGNARGRVVLVTGMNPTKFGEGKTLTTIGLGQALHHIGVSSIICLREPSLGPVFGVKGGATGGGKSQLVPFDDINLHFTGDMHAISAATNLLAALVDAHIHHGNALGLDPQRIAVPRAIDMNDRALRNVVVGLGGRANGPPRETEFVITAASEVMAVLCLATSLDDLIARLARVVVGRTYDGRFVTAAELGAAGAMAALLKDAIKPNLVQTLVGSPAIVHGGPFGNIAHGTSSVLGTTLAMRLADVVVQEAGFGADLGAEKFFHIASRAGDYWPTAAVMVATARAIKLHGGASDPSVPDADALERGFANLDHHIGIITRAGVPVVVSVNRFAGDDDSELDAIVAHCKKLGVDAFETDFHGIGPEGGLGLANRLSELVRAGKPSEPKRVYELDAPVKDKIASVAREVYGADGVKFDYQADRAIQELEQAGFGGLPICIAKTQFSISDKAPLKGAPKGWNLEVRDVYPSAGAGFLVVIAGDINRMPGLGKQPAAAGMALGADGKISGLR